MIKTVLSVRPIALPAADRGTDLEVRVTAPLTGTDLPVIVFSHGAMQSMDAYAPLVDAWTAHGFAVIQPTHLDSASLNVTPDDPRYADIWRFRVEDMSRILDNLDLIENAVPGLAGRLSHEQIIAAGHSWGAQTASMLLGARVLDSDGVPENDRTDLRFKAGLLFALPGTGFGDLTPFAAQNFSFMNPGFTTMTAPALIVTGDKDQSLLSVRGPEWFTDGYHQSPGPKTLLTLHGGEHTLGGIHAYRSTDTTDESPDRVALIQEVTLAYLHSVLTEAALDHRAVDVPTELGHLESK
ncbi:chlorophyllase [Actinoplanes sp. NPDC051851]|uniref:alpha/beta hydrolase family protein n=1 Tax=Actinoplanes sp. NPDC051851 TaxID=3154753 RepID=UPI0034372628